MLNKELGTGLVHESSVFFKKIASDELCLKT